MQILGCARAFVDESNNTPQVPFIHFRLRALPKSLIVATFFMALGIVALLVMESGNSPPGGANQSPADAGRVSDAASPVEVTRVATSVMPPMRAAVPPLATSASRAPPPWQTSLQPAVVATIREDALSAYQVQMDSWTCEGEQCVGKLRIPPTVEAGRRGDMGAGANIFDSLKARMAKENVDVGLMAIHPSPEGLAIAFQFTPNAALQGRYYTTAEIAAIRLESFEQGRKEREQAGTH